MTGSLPPPRDGTRTTVSPCARVRWTPDPALPPEPPVPDSRFQGGRENVTASGCRQSDESLFCVTTAWRGMVSGGFNKPFVNWNWVHMQSALSPASRYRTTSTSSGSLPCAPATWVCTACTSPGSSRSRKRWVTPSSPLLPTHHYDERRRFCPVVPASWGRVGQSPKLPVTRRGRKN